MSRKRVSAAPGVLVLLAVTAAGCAGNPSVEVTAPEAADRQAKRGEIHLTQAVGPAKADRERKTVAEHREQTRERREAEIRWRRSRAAGKPTSGRLIAGVELPSQGADFFSWDPVRWQSPNRAARLNATDRLIRKLLVVASKYRKRNPGAPRVAVGDLSRPQGGDFGVAYGAVEEFGRGDEQLGHVSHQNGLDADIYYPRKDKRERAPRSVQDVDAELAQALVDGFVAAGAEFVFVGPNTSLTGPPGVVQALPRHDDHLHVRLPSGG